MSKLKGVVSHHEREVAELCADRELAIQYLKARWKRSTIPTIGRAACWRCAPLRKPMAGLGPWRPRPASARVAVSRAVAKRQPDAQDLLAVLKTVGMRLSVEPSVMSTLNQLERRHFFMVDGGAFLASAGFRRGLASSASYTPHALNLVRPVSSRSPSAGAMSCAARALTFRCRAIIGAVTSGLESTNSARAGRPALDFSFWQRRRNRASASASRSSSSSPARAAAWIAASAAPIRVVRSWLCRRSRGMARRPTFRQGRWRAPCRVAATGRRPAAVRASFGVRAAQYPATPRGRWPREGRRQLARRFDLVSPVGEPTGLVEILVVDQRAGGVRRGLSRRRRGAGSFSQQPRRAFDGASIAANSSPSGSTSATRNAAAVLAPPFPFSAQVVEAAPRKRPGGAPAMRRRARSTAWRGSIRGWACEDPFRRRGERGLRGGRVRRRARGWRRRRENARGR